MNISPSTGQDISRPLEILRDQQQPPEMISKVQEQMLRQQLPDTYPTASIQNISQDGYPIVASVGQVIKNPDGYPLVTNAEKLIKM